MSRVAALLRALAGVPDYERYAAHMARAHPGVPLLSRGELVAQCQRNRFERPGGKCC
ncbi:MAG: CstA-like transporter-associated (seleno)protein [Gemmatimonadaceae bacterium]